MDLFSQSVSAASQPLAARMRPRNLDEYVGQSHLVGPGKPLRKLVESRRPASFILWGPPGVGKTTLAGIVAEATGARFVTLSAVGAGVKELREVIDSAREAQHMHGQQTVLFIDEIHRWSKSQQDALLPHVEDGTVYLIGATTENVSFELNSALLSRCRVFVLKSLDEADLVSLLRQAMTDSERGLGKPKLHASDETLARIARAAAGDARRALILLETAADFAIDAGGHELIDGGVLEDALGSSIAKIDRAGDAHYDLLSAIHKSIRSSRQDAALFYIARFISAGGDALDVVRRLAAIASEDVGNADPKALPLVMAAWDAYLRLGAYEGERAIAHAAIYLSIAPKSGAVDDAWAKAKQLAKQYPAAEPPRYIRNAPTQLMAELGNKVGYRYAHDEPNGYPAGQSHNCWPEDVPKVRLYQPTNHGHEKRFAEMMAWRAGLDQAHDQKIKK